MFKQLFACVALATMVMTIPVNAQSSPPTSAKAKQIEAIVNKAATLVESKGNVAFAEFKTKGTEWFHDDTNLFVYDLKSNVLLNAAFPAREGTNTTGQKDAKGKLFHHDFIAMAESKGSGWVDYMFPKPGADNRHRNGRSEGSKSGWSSEFDRVWLLSRVMPTNYARIHLLKWKPTENPVGFFLLIWAKMPRVRFGSFATEPSRAQIKTCVLLSKSEQTRVRLDCPLCVPRTDIQEFSSHQNPGTLPGALLSEWRPYHQNL